MTPSSPLDQLRDIHPPADIGWWPLATFWWILLLALILMLISSVYLLLKHRKENAWRRTALIELHTLTSRRTDSPSDEFASQLNTLIKRCLCSANRNNEALSASGSQFASLLESAKCKQRLSQDLIHTLSYGIYTADCPQVSSAQLGQIQTWIKGLSRV
jgi:hypothetical protein